ncbi:ABC transporter substrate-binding protein [Actinoalloteichus caeruleus]|uniref:ABC transporter substrate-binding protein n=1 Tax=Actinoalloteichus cyanogriseus TaxID=2893586 RepID=UPI003AAAA9A7
MVRPNRWTAPTSRPVRVAAVGTALSLTALLSGCGLLDGSSGADESAAEGGGQVEKSDITIGYNPIIDVAPIFYADENGYFADEGLNVTTERTTSGAEAIASLAGGSLDFTYGSHVAFMAAQASGIADLKIVGDAYTALEDNVAIMTVPDSGVETPEDLADVSIGINAERSLADLLSISAMTSNGVDVAYDDVNWQQMAMPDLPTALANGDIKAALLPEPFLTQAAMEYGAFKVLDAAEGPTAEWPLGGYVVSADFAEENPRTVAAFQRALVRASGALVDQGELEQILPEVAGIEEDIVSVLNFGAFPTTLEAERIQRVATLMSQFSFIEEPIDVEDMIVPLPED